MIDLPLNRDWYEIWVRVSDVAEMLDERREFMYQWGDYIDLS